MSSRWNHRTEGSAYRGLVRVTGVNGLQLTELHTHQVGDNMNKEQQELAEIATRLDIEVMFAQIEKSPAKARVLEAAAKQAWRNYFDLCEGVHSER